MSSDKGFWAYGREAGVVFVPPAEPLAPTEELVVNADALSSEVRGGLFVTEDGRTLEAIEVTPGQQISLQVRESKIFHGLGTVLNGREVDLGAESKSN